MFARYRRLALGTARGIDSRYPFVCLIFAGESDQNYPAIDCLIVPRERMPQAGFL